MLTNLKQGTYNFISTTQEKKFNRNIKFNSSLMDKLGWKSISSVEYKINSLGFRSDYEFVQNEECNVFLGCSYTFGEEVPLKDCWTTLVNHHLKDYKMYNLGICGGSTMSCYRALKYAVENFNVKRVFLLKPYINRKDFFFENKWETFSLHNTPFKEKKLLMTIFNDNAVRLEKHMAFDAIENICKNIKLYSLDVEDEEINRKISSDRSARDLMHFGKNTHSFIANKFIEMINDEH